MKSARIYGFVNDFGSYAQVTRGFDHAFTLHGYTRDTVEVVSLETSVTFDEEPSGLPAADVGILTGPPVASPRLMQGVTHARRFVMVAPNSTKLPERTMHSVNGAATEILVPSVWAAGVVSKYTTLPVIVVPHGIAEHYRPVPPALDLEAAYASGCFRILHLSSSDGQRKGTVELVRAFVDALKRKELPSKAELRLVLTPRGLGQISELLSDMRLDGEGREHLAQVHPMARFGIAGVGPKAMSEIYSSVHLVCQPSRGEGFGMVPLEALAAGAPIAATRATGHEQWFTKNLAGAVPIATGAYSAIDDMTGAEAPSLLVDDVRQAIVKGYDAWHALKAEALGHAPTIRNKWSWKAQLHEFIENL